MVIGCFITSPPTPPYMHTLKAQKRSAIFLMLSQYLLEGCHTTPLIAMSIFILLSHFLMSITVVSASAVYALNCRRDNFWNPGWIPRWGLWPFHSKDFNQFWNTVPFSMRNMLSNSSTSLPQHLAEEFRKMALFSFLMSVFISFQYLGNKRIKNISFLFHTKTSRKRVCFRSFSL